MDGALRASIAIACDKAHTAALFEQTTAALAAKVLPGQSLFGMRTPRFLPIAGGVPLWSDDVLVGSGGRQLGHDRAGRRDCPARAPQCFNQ